MHLRYNIPNILRSTMCLSSLLSIMSPVSSSPLGNANSNTPYNCQPLDKINTVCSRWYRYTQLPNVFGHDTPEKALHELNSVVDKIPNPSDDVLSFMCVMYFPPCTVTPSGSYHQSVPLPCRVMCENAANARASKGNNNNNNGGSFRSWPVMCHTLPSQRCYVFERVTGITFVKTAIGVPIKTNKVNQIPKVASIESELGDGDGYDLEIVSLAPNQERGRRYDITDLGDPDLFHGWADVQGRGSANDYCRVVGKSKRRFLSCHLAGNANQGHHYVSKLGFDLGYHGTWFMRDMDGDDRDDYCRCVGSPSDSKVTCMKAGERGFYGSPMQSGSQHTFVLTSSTGCHNRQVNAMFGE